MKRASFGAGLYVVLLLPPVLKWMESIMMIHMLIQLPLLIVVGWMAGEKVVSLFHLFFQKWNANGVPGILVAVFITMYWMLPRVLDESLTYWYMEVFKLIGLPLMGIIAYDSWKKIQANWKSFLFLNYLSMFGLMAWIYIDSPVQICNNYLEAEQKALGWGFVFITAFMIIYLIQYVFVDHSEEI